MPSSAARDSRFGSGALAGSAYSGLSGMRTIESLSEYSLWTCRWTKRGLMIGAEAKGDFSLRSAPAGPLESADERAPDLRPQPGGAALLEHVADPRPDVALGPAAVP